MRTFLLLMAGVLMTQATLSKADVLEADDFQDQESASEYMEFDGAANYVPPAGQGWNKWTCTSRSAAPVRIFRGSSYYFRPGSGEGQQAKAVALKIAYRNCQFASMRGCSNNLSNCQVTNQ